MTPVTALHRRPHPPPYNSEEYLRPLSALGDQRGTGYYRPGPVDASGPGVLFFNMSMLNTQPIPTLLEHKVNDGLPSSLSGT